MYLFCCFIDALRVDKSTVQNQEYCLKHDDPKQRSFVVVIQDDFMRGNAKRFSKGCSLAFDSIFRMNQYDLPLCAAVVPNQDGKAMPVFYMLSSKDKDGGHEGIAIELALVHVFSNIGDIRPSAFIIDICKTSLNVINHVVNNDIHCWKHGILGEEQVAQQVLLCWFHVMKA